MKQEAPQLQHNNQACKAKCRETGCHPRCTTINGVSPLSSHFSAALATLKTVSKTTSRLLDLTYSSALIAPSDDDETRRAGAACSP